MKINDLVIDHDLSECPMKARVISINKNGCVVQEKNGLKIKYKPTEYKHLTIVI